MESSYENSESNEVKNESDVNFKKKRSKKRKKAKVSDIDKQIESLKQRRKNILNQSRYDIGDFIINTLEKEGISLELIEDNQELFLEELENIVLSDIDNIKEILD